MLLDPATIFIANSIVVVLCGGAFIVNAAFTRNDASGRIWSMGFIAAIVVGLSYGLFLIAPEAWWGLAIGNICLGVVIAAMWSGTRLFNGRGPGLVVVLPVMMVVAVTSLITAPAGGEWAGVMPVWSAMALFGVLAALESMRGRLARNLNGRIISGTMWVFAAFTLGRTLSLLLEGPAGPTFSVFFTSANASLVYLCLIIVTSTAVSVLRAEKVGVNAVGDFTDGIMSAAGVTSADAFEQAADDHLERARSVQAGLVLIGADIDSLPEINTAFGRAVGDEAIYRFAQTLRRHAPVMALIGHETAGRFLLLCAVSGSSEAMTLAERLQSALVDDPLTEVGQVRLAASFSIADTFDHGHDMTALRAAVDHGIVQVKQAGGNLISVAAPA
ncbi:MAG: diguanylate cyclase [Cryobacterium sp.]